MSLVLIAMNTTKGSIGGAVYSSDCPTTELSAGSAAFIVIAIMLRLLVQPDGCLCLPPTLSNYGIWHFSPLHSAVETGTIPFYLIRGAILKQAHFEVATA